MERFQFNSKLDQEFLDSIYEDDIEHAEMVFNQFLVSIHGMMKAVEDGFMSHDKEVFRKKIHKIKPVLSFVGLTNLTQKAAGIEKSCKEINHISRISLSYQEFKKEVLEMIPVIEDDLSKLKASQL